MGTSSLPLSIIADVTVVTSSPQVAAPSFNTGLIIGTSPVIPSVGPNSRVRKYLAATFSTAMISDGFLITYPEYIATQMYFSQSPQPQAVFIGRQDLTGLGTVVPTAGSLGTGYVVGDSVFPTQPPGTGGVLRVTSVGASGTVTGLAIIASGTGFVPATALPTTTSGVGVGLEVDITAIGESALNAAIACRQASAQWYPYMVTDAVSADHTALAQFTQSQIGTVYLGTTADAAVLNGTVGNFAKNIYSANSSRTWLQYATTQAGLVPNQAYFVASVMGQMMASNTQLVNSSFTEKFSGGVPLVGVVTEPGLSTTQIANIEGSSTATGPNLNLYMNYAEAFNVLEQGTMMAPNVFFDQIIGLDILASNIQFSIMNLLTSVPKVPQTDAGQQLLIQAVEQALAVSANTGFIAPGVWQGQTVLSITPGTALPTGYKVVSPKYSTLTQAQIQLRQAPPIYVALIEAGAVHFVTIAVQVQV